MNDRVCAAKIWINLDDGWFRVMYVAKFHEAVYVLHCFKKKTAKCILGLKPGFHVLTG